MSYGLCLPNVTEFEIYMNCARLEPCPAYVTLLKAFDFTRTVPALTKVGINDHKTSGPYEEIQNFIEQGNGALREPMLLDGAVNIKELCVTDYFSPQTVPFLAETFGNIEVLSIEDNWYPMFRCEQIWNHWTHLKTIEAMIYGSYDAENYLHVDSNICGIFPEEVAELREKDEEFLKRVNIIPVMPSIACFPELRTFKLIYVLLSADDPERNNHLICSQVSGLLVFARCPNLFVTIQNYYWPEQEMKEVLDHMKPYASVVLQSGMPGRCGCDVEELGGD